MQILRTIIQSGDDPEITNISTMTKQSITGSIVKDSLAVHGLYADISNIVTGYLISSEYQDIFHSYLQEEIRARDKQVNERLQQQATQSEAETETKEDAPDGQLRQRKVPTKRDKDQT
jgi:hypothetical protein